ncbi:MAG: Asp-tRNA(Asn)/Glu-tRNA(Gln) amidotransferase subunit GatA [Propionibacteriaceae bacterium]|jgi:aspartyl-tRNA(Asn)/glutamyl-tRNA(Gln) amidotransferase subunit A|nr:Asp-tRNA(Asn)/Glu-tRNA(Gln) amidotransferase subunit GatA [Propionibacteriaceae bacterium]
MNPLIHTPAVELGRMIATGETCSEEVVQAHLDRIGAVDSDINAFLYVDTERALAQARAVDARVAAGERLGPLAGVPIGVKDAFTYMGAPTTCGSAMLRDWRPPYTSTVVQHLLDAGLVILGKTNMDEFAMGSSTENSAFGPTHNPWDLTRIPGGSGGGSSAALAAFEAPLAIGSDTGGSIRQPASVTGTVGVKPTYGGCSRYGLVATASSLDQAGPCARSVMDAALLHQVMAGYDPKDSTSIDQPVPGVVEAAGRRDVKGMRIGVVTDLGGEGYAPGVTQRFNETVELLAGADAEIVEVSCPYFRYALPAYYLIMPSEVSSNLARFDAMRYGLRVGDDGSHSAEQVMKLSRGANFGPEVIRRVILGTYALSSGYYDAYYGSAQKVRTLIIRDFSRAFEQADVLVSPATPTTAFKLGERVDDPMAMYQADLATIPTNLAGNTAASFPVGLAPEDGLPVGFQVMAPPMREDRVYQVGSAVEALWEDTWGAPLWTQLVTREDAR